MKRLIKWNRRRRFLKAYKILRREADRHLDAGHMMEFTATGENHIQMNCYNCPNPRP